MVESSNTGSHQIALNFKWEEINCVQNIFILDQVHSKITFFSINTESFCRMCIFYINKCLLTKMFTSKTKGLRDFRSLVLSSLQSCLWYIEQDVHLLYKCLMISMFTSKTKGQRNFRSLVLNNLQSCLWFWYISTCIWLLTVYKNTFLSF